MALTQNDLLDLSSDELDDLFRRSPAGEIPNGDADGKVLVGSENDKVSDNVAWIAKTLAWKGKVFNREKGDLKNKILPFGIKAVRAKVYKEASWFDGKETIVLDYSKTSFVRAEGARRDPRGRSGPLPRARVLGEGQGPPLLARFRPVTRAATASSMPYQRSLTIVAPVREGAEDEVESLLATMGDGVANGSVIDFGALDGVHFARLIMAPADTDHVRRAAARERDPAQRLRRRRGRSPRAARRDRGRGDRPGLRALRGLSGGAAGCGERLDYLRRHVVQGGGEVREHDGPHRAPDPSGVGAPRRDRGGRSTTLRATGHGRDPDDVRRAVRELVAQDPELAGALEPAERPALAARAKDKVHLVAVPLLTLPFLPILLARGAVLRSCSCASTRSATRRRT